MVAFNSEHPEGGKILQSDVQGRQVSVTVDDDYYDRIGIYERQTGYGGVSTLREAVPWSISRADVE